VKSAFENYKRYDRFCPNRQLLTALVNARYKKTHYTLQPQHVTALQLNQQSVVSDTDHCNGKDNFPPRLYGNRYYLHRHRVRMTTIH